MAHIQGEVPHRLSDLAGRNPCTNRVYIFATLELARLSQPVKFSCEFQVLSTLHLIFHRRSNFFLPWNKC